MSAMFVLIFFSILVAGGFLIAFLRSVKSGQFDDGYTPSVRMLLDDEDNNEVITDNSSRIRKKQKDE